jgi:NADH dehydrogenase FAD-containing subunit
VNTKPRVAVIGAGFAGLETIFCLRHLLGDSVELSLVSNDKNFVFRPDTIYIPFGADPKRFVVPLARPLANTGTRVVYDRARAIDREDQKVVLREGEVPYDFLVVATGAGVRPDEVPGLAEHATSLWTAGGMLRLRRAYERLLEVAQQGHRQRLVFVVPPHNLCTSPVYELALMTDTWLRSNGARERVEMTLATYEDNLIEAFGFRFDGLMRRRFAEDGVTLRTGLVVTEVEPRHCRFEGGERLPFDVLVSFPPHVVPHPFEGLPSDERGYVRVDKHSRRVAGPDRVYAIGDASTYPAKRAYLALLQAGVAAEHIAAEIEGRAPRLSFPRVCETLVQAMKETTLHDTGPRPAQGFPPPWNRLSPDQFEVGVSPLWRAGTRTVGLHFNWRLAPGEPFYTRLDTL